MKALSIRQPWAWLIIHGGKNIENRTWNTKFRGRFLVHSANKPALNRKEFLAFLNFWMIPADALEFGGIIGSVELVDVIQTNNIRSNWWLGPHGFVLKEPKALDFHPYIGALNFFNVPDWTTDE